MDGLPQVPGWLVLDDEVAAQARCDTLSAALGYPDATSGTLRYAEPVALDDGRAAIRIIAEAVPHLTGDELAAVTGTLG